MSGLNDTNAYRCMTCGNYYPTHYSACPECFETRIPSILRQQPATTSRLAEFDKEVATITQRRGETYGPPSIDFDRISRLKSVVSECRDPLVRHVLEVMCLKMARLINSPAHLDSWIDMAGYARCGVMVSEPKPVKLVEENKKDCATGAIERLDTDRHERFTDARRGS